MTEEHKELLINFETRVRHLMLMCNSLKNENEKLNELLTKEKEKTMKALDTVRELTIKCDHQNLADCLIGTSNDVSNAKKRVTKLVREIDKCIALLNE